MPLRVAYRRVPGLIARGVLRAEGEIENVLPNNQRQRRTERLIMCCQTISVSAAARRIVPHTVPRVGRSHEHFPDGF
jgi:hypothetical protein